MKVGIIGTGLVGSTAAYAMVMRDIGREIVLVDLNKARAEAEANDILHAAPFVSEIYVRAGEYADLVDCNAVVVTAGVAQKPGESRLSLLERNTAVFRQIIPSILEAAPQTELVIVSNPVDIMTHISAKIAAEYGVPSSRVIGSGTTLDTARFRALLSVELGIDSSHIHAYVVGEHGDSEVLNWSSVSVGGIQLDDYCANHHLEICEERRQELDDEVRNAAYHIIEGKGATYYGIGAALARIVNTILRNQRSILTVCTPLEEIVGVQNVTLSIPQLVGGQGILDTFPPIMDDAELAALRSSAMVIREAIASIEDSLGV
jgi:L-lactate dehydrogenase